jgi:FkbM family methyltransferase
MKYGTALPHGFHIPSSAFWLQKDLTTQNPFELLTIELGDRIMDCGAYIGTFAAACMEQGASAVTCYEASPTTAQMLRDNLARYPTASVIEGALTWSNEDRVFLGMSSFEGSNSIVGGSVNATKGMFVKGINFRDELLRVKPHVLKLDVEGAEYGLLDMVQPKDLEGVRAIFVEFHPTVDQSAKIATFQAFIEHQGFFVHSKRKRAFIADRTLHGAERTLFS